MLWLRLRLALFFFFLFFVWRLGQTEIVEMGGLLWWAVSGVSFLLEMFKDKLFARLRKAADPSPQDEENFDFEAMSKWIVFEQFFDLMCVMLVIFPGWICSFSCWRNLLTASLPKLRKKALFWRALYVSMETGYRSANAIRAAVEKNYVSLVSHSLCFASLVFGLSDHLIGFLLVRQFAALLQSLYTISGIEFLSRKVFSTVLNVAQLVLILANLKINDPLFCAMEAIYVYQLVKPLAGFYFKK